ncbi:hypothetical protein PR048_032831 [Dryococelus australis]|uniref:Uncharacterized protein n=1 Tax=Dryococelus australis TaxID=614101 RepID=A0ABQ9G7F9_9NEOP|nr:hypothetical protein PR048_032831 [Dryococelus australis]
MNTHATRCSDDLRAGDVAFTRARALPGWLGDGVVISACGALSRLVANYTLYVATHLSSISVGVRMCPGARSTNHASGRLATTAPRRRPANLPGALLPAAASWCPAPRHLHTPARNHTPSEEVHVAAMRTYHLPHFVLLGTPGTLTAPYQPSRSQDLNPLDFYFRGHLKVLVYATRVDDVGILRNCIAVACETIKKFSRDSSMHPGVNTMCEVSCIMQSNAAMAFHSNMIQPMGRTLYIMHYGLSESSPGRSPVEGGKPRDIAVAIHTQLMTSLFATAMREVLRADECEECKGGGNGRHPRKPTDQWRRVARLPHAIIRERYAGKLFKVKRAHLKALLKMHVVYPSALCKINIDTGLITLFMSRTRLESATLVRWELVWGGGGQEGCAEARSSPLNTAQDAIPDPRAANEVVTLSSQGTYTLFRLCVLLYSVSLPVPSYDPFTVTYSFPEALPKFYFQDISPAHTNKDYPTPVSLVHILPPLLHLRLILPHPFLRLARTTADVSVLNSRLESATDIARLQLQIVAVGYLRGGYSVCYSAAIVYPGGTTRKTFKDPELSSEFVAHFTLDCYLEANHFLFVLAICELGDKRLAVLHFVRSRRRCFCPCLAAVEEVSKGNKLSRSSHTKVSERVEYIQDVSKSDRQVSPAISAANDVSHTQGSFLVGRYVLLCTLKTIQATSYATSQIEDTVTERVKKKNRNDVLLGFVSAPPHSGIDIVFIELCQFVTINWGSGGAVARALATHHGDPGVMPGGFTPGFSHVGIVLDDAACRQVFSGYSRFPPPLHSSAAPS